MRRADEWREDVVNFLSQHAASDATGFIETDADPRWAGHKTREKLRARAVKLREIADRLDAK
jgi:hypothetical protein